MARDRVMVVGRENDNPDLDYVVAWIYRQKSMVLTGSAHRKFKVGRQFWLESDNGTTVVTPYEDDPLLFGYVTKTMEKGYLGKPYFSELDVLLLHSDTNSDNKLLEEGEEFWFLPQGLKENRLISKDFGFNDEEKGLKYFSGIILNYHPGKDYVTRHESGKIVVLKNSLKRLGEGVPKGEWIKYLIQGENDQVATSIDYKLAQSLPKHPKTSK